MTTLELAARAEWLRWGAYAKWTACADCHEMRHCRSRGGTRFLCLDCHGLR